jgi:purine nucleoside permease
MRSAQPVLVSSASFRTVFPEIAMSLRAARPTLLCFSLLFLFASAHLAPALRAQTKPWPVKIVILATFERGEDTGDQPGEFQFWVEREHLDEKLDFPGGERPLRASADHTVIGMVTGTTLVNAGASVMALGLDPRFDLTHAYWLMNGIAGVNPEVASLGSAAWANYVVNDVAREIDPREAPADWPYGLFAIGALRPNTLPDQPLVASDRIGAYALNAGLADWAFQLTQNLKLGDTPDLQAARSLWQGFPNAQRPPFVLKGDSFASDYYWGGKIMTQYADDWVKLWTSGKGTFVMTEMEDSAVAEALRRLDAMHRADFRRLMVLRTGSDYCMPAPGQTAVASVTARYPGYIPALESAYAAGSTVIHALLADWPKYADHVPGD